MNVTPTSVTNIKSLTLSGGQFGNLHVTNDITFSHNSPPDYSWNYDTIMYAPLIKDLFAGNINYSVKQISSVRIKRRRKGTFKWITIYEIPINSVEDFRFDRFDKYNRFSDYDYALVPVMGGIEGNMNINTVKSTFEGMYIADKNDMFGTVLDISLPSINRVKPTSVIQTLGSKYPFVVSNGSVNYEQGRITALFLEEDENGDLKTKDNVDYRKRITDFLTNGQPKILKLDDGRCWMIRVIDDTVNEESGHPDKITISFSFVQVGDDESSNDLYYNNFTDVNIEGD